MNTALIQLKDGTQFRVKCPNWQYVKTALQPGEQGMLETGLGDGWIRRFSFSTSGAVVAVFADYVTGEDRVVNGNDVQCVVP